MSDQTNQRIDVYLLCNAKYHDTNFSRLELLKLLAEHEDVWTCVGDSYRDIDAINQSRLLITYTCDLCPTVEEQVGLKRFLQSGGRWLALHGTNALIEFTDSGKVGTPDSAPELMRMLGSRFVAHPDIQPLRIRIADPAHPLVAGIADFTVEDEPYYCEHFGDNRVLLESDYDTPSSALRAIGIRFRPGAASADVPTSLRRGRGVVPDARPLLRQVRPATARGSVPDQALRVGIADILRIAQARHPLGNRCARGEHLSRTVNLAEKCPDRGSGR